MGGATLDISGPEAEAIATEVAAWWKAELGEELRPRPATRPDPGDTTRSPDPIAVAGLVVSVVALVTSLPGSILATADLAKRAELGKKLAAFSEWVREKRRKHPKRRGRWRTRDARSRRQTPDAPRWPS